MITNELTATGTIIEQIKEESNRFQGLALEISKIVVGQDNAISSILMAILCNGHILLEGVPGIAKTTMIKVVTKAIGLSCNRIQFTPDLLPSDVIGTLIYNQKTAEFETKKGPIFSHLVLADEINRAPAKVQAALLEAMQERQVTIGSTTYALERPFLVFATQNPIEQEGTYTLPEAQVDRFMFKILMSYPPRHHEKEIIKREMIPVSVTQVLSKEEIFSAQELVRQVYVDERIIDYIIAIIFATRNPAQEPKLKDIESYIAHGVSPRATLFLYHAAKAHAFLRRRNFVTPDDVKAIAPLVLRHRIGVTYEAEANFITPDTLIQKILNSVSVP